MCTIYYQGIQSEVAKMTKKWKIWVSISLILGILLTCLIIQQVIRLQSRPVVYTEPQAYSIVFPGNWKIDGGGQKSGYEILSIYSYDYQKVTNPGGGFGRGQIKIAVSIVDKEAKTLTRIVNEKFTGTEKSFKKEFLNIDGHKAIRISGIFDAGDAFSPMIETFIDYSENEYAWLVGYHSGDRKSAATIMKVEESFKVLK